MEFVVIIGGSAESNQSFSDQLRARGFHSFDPKLYFMNDCGEVNVDERNLRQAEVWCEHHAMIEVKRHHNIVVSGVYINPVLLSLAEQEGYTISLIRLDQKSAEECQQEIDLIASNSGESSSWIKKILHR